VRIALISKADRFGGGASKIAEDLARELTAAGHTVVHFVSWTRQGYDNQRRRLYGERWQRKFYRWSRAVKSWFAPDVIPFEWPNLYLQNMPNNFDIVHVHDISSAASPLSIRWLANQLPLLWTFHDCSGFTGGCVYFVDCDKYKTSCHNCPQHGIPPLDGKYDYSRLRHKTNKYALRSPLVQVAAPSKWMQQQANESGLLTNPALLLPNGVDTSVFHLPTEKPDKFSELGLGDKPVVLLAAASLDYPYKGIQYAIEALNLLQQSGIEFQLLLVGEASVDLIKRFSNLKPVVAGLAQTPEQMRDLFWCADVMLFPSIAENQPLQVIEALACGLPIVTTNVGGIPELLQVENAGLVVPARDSLALATALKNQLQQNVGHDSRKSVSEHITKHFNFNTLVNNHLQTYEKVIAHWQKQKEQR